MRLPLFPATVVGSWPRPKWLLDAIGAAEAGQLSRAVLPRYMDDAVLVAVRAQEEAGIDLVTDGEQRRYSFLAVIGERLAGFRLMNIVELARGRRRVLEIIEELQLPRSVPQPIVVDRLMGRGSIAVEEVRYLRRHTRRLIKVALPSPYMLSWQAWDHEYSRKAYPTPEDLADDLSRILREEILRLRDAGATFVQLDDPTIQNPLNPETYTRFLTALLGHRPRPSAEELRWAVELVNQTVRGITGVTIGFHVCRGNWPAPEERLPRGDYGPILPSLLELKVDQLVLEFATPRAGSIDVFADYPTRHQLGLGVIDVKDRRVERVATVVARVEQALRYFDAEQLYLNPDCGFASGRTWPVASRTVAQRKLHVLTKAAALLRRGHGGDGGGSPLR